MMVNIMPFCLILRDDTLKLIKPLKAHIKVLVFLKENIQEHVTNCS